MRDLRVHVNGAEDAGIPDRLLSRAVLRALEDAGVAAGEVSLTLLDDAAISELNARYLGHDGPTDVLSFALHDPGEAPLGDVYVGWRQAARQAEAEGVPLEEELVRLAVHGTLHVLGHDHPEGPDRSGSPMYRRQERLVREILGRD